MAASHRLRQGVRALLAFSHPVDYDLAARYLPPPLLALFRQMRRSEQLHSLNVLRDLLAQGPTPDDLALAALLHDVGKTRYPTVLWQRTFAVLLPLAAPRLARRWSEGNPANSLQRPFVVRAQHPAWSAELLAEAGASERAVWLVGHHQEPAASHAQHPHVDLLKRLQAADDAN